MVHQFSDIELLDPMNKDWDFLGHLHQEFDVERTIINQEDINYKHLQIII